MTPQSLSLRPIVRFFPRWTTFFLLLLAGMEAGVGLIEVRDGQAQVALGRRQGAVAQEILATGQPGAIQTTATAPDSVIFLMGIAGHLPVLTQIPSAA